MSGATKKRVVSPEGHFNAIQQPIGDDDTILDKRLGCLVDRHGDRGVIIGGADDEVDPGQDGLLIGPM